MVGIYVMAVVAVLVGWCLGYALGCFHEGKLYESKVKTLQFDVDVAHADLEAKRLALKEQISRYDELYTRFIKLNRMNTDLSKWMLLTESFTKREGDSVYVQYLHGASRRELSKRFGVSYPLICKIIQDHEKKQNRLF